MTPYSRPLDAFNDFERPAMAAGTHMFGKTAVVISPNVPKFHAADELVPVMPSRLYCFVLWLFDGRAPQPLRYRAGKKIEHEQAFQMAGKLFMSPAMWAELSKRK